MCTLLTRTDFPATIATTNHGTQLRIVRKHTNRVLVVLRSASYLEISERRVNDNGKRFTNRSVQRWLKQTTYPLRNSRDEISRGTVMEYVYGDPRERNSR